MNETMTAGLFAIVGVFLGWLLNWISTTQDRRERQKEQRLKDSVERQNRLEQQKIAAYVRLMVSGRRLRYIARRLMTDDKLYDGNGVTEEEEIEARTDFYTARYEINILSPKDSVETVHKYHEAIGAFLRAARQTPGSPHLKSLRTAAGRAQDELETRFREEIGVGIAAMWYEDSARSHLLPASKWSTASGLIRATRYGNKRPAAKGDLMPENDNDIQKRERTTIDEAREQGVGEAEDGIELSVPSYADDGGNSDLGVDEPVVSKPLRGEPPPKSDQGR